MIRTPLILLAGALALSLALPCAAQHQTETFSPVQIGSTLPYLVELQEVSFGATELPTLHSYAAATYDGKWVVLAGRTNGLHSFESVPANNFPEQYQNRDVWVIDPVSMQSWHKSLEDVTSGLTANQIASLTPTNNQFTQIGDRLYVTGGYGIPGSGSGFTTFDTLSAIDLDGIVDWVVNGTGQAADHIRQASDPLFQVTGGAMYEMNDRLHLVFGQDFQGGYVPGKTGDYTKQVRSFAVVDNGTTVSITDDSTTPEVDAYRRRDLNVFPVMRPNGGGGLEEGLVVLAGVFTPDNGAWTVPVEIDADGLPTMADPELSSTFKQAMNQYHSAKLGLFSATQESMHELLFGGITLQYYDDVAEEFVQDDNMPWTSQITSVVIDRNGQYSQHLVGAFPALTDLEDNLLRLGANAEFFLADGIATYDNGVINLDALSGETVVGYVFGGIASNAPHVRGVPGAVSAASNRIFQVLITLQDGDYNRDGKVSAADYTMWRDTLGASVPLGSGADGDSDGTITSFDYQIWLDNFGESLQSPVLGTAAGSVTLVPEPSAMVLALIILGAWGIAPVTFGRRG